ncbi:hypothetical protein CVV68_15245 [Arthrobacter livingstonensis]|uniref:Uncharacterized protein n=1 Tax=Arthrobacter livingstonensis TaxID=670078 RepID=A0A2V5L3Z3_9MICC|nr:hypothetical protein [Arthrobacter livingstonensis]PYI66151.1 hypothetical protein CVV68_15245 [Arthrobacter livingstonensis]
MTEQNASTTAVASERKGPGVSKALLGPLTARDITALAGVLVIFVASLLPVVFRFGITGNLWNFFGLFFIGIGVILPLVVAVLFVIRRLSPEMKPRVGSLSADQFASVVAGFSTAFFFVNVVTGFQVSYLVGLVGALVLLAATVLARWIPLFAADFAGRAETPAHSVARDAVAATRRPAAPKPVLALSAGPAAGARPGQPGQNQTGQFQQAPGQAQAGQGWNSGVQAPVHTAAGQIFTPAGDAASSGQGTGASTPDAAAPGAAGSHAAGSNAGSSNALTPDSATPGAESAAGDAGGRKAAEAATAHGAAAQIPDSTGAPEAAGSKATDAFVRAAVNSDGTTVPQGTGVDAGVVPSAEDAADSAPATMLNPKVVDAAPPAESIGATVDPQAAAQFVADPFWFAVDRPQNVVDQHTRQFVFKLIPGSWILALEDRGSSFLVQDSHGKTGLLLDLVGVERAPEGQ